MKIIFAVNTYTSFEKLNQRQKLCIKSLQRLKKRASQDIKIISLQFKEDNFIYQQFDKVVKLKQSSQDLINESNKKYPIITDIFKTLSNEDCDYFVFLNDDIIVRDSILQYVLNNKKPYDAYIASRVDIQLQDDETYTPVSYNIHGFDLFCIKKEWWLQKQNYFPPMIVGKYFWDTIYYSLCKIHGNVKTINSLPEVILHPIHNSHHSLREPEHLYNSKIVNNEIYNMWLKVANSVFCNRIDCNGIKNSIPTQDEENMSNIFYKQYYEKNISDIC